MRISDFTRGRDNNFNLIRMVAAYAVLVSHSFVVALGTRESEPLRETLGMTIGSIAVDVFFVTSGFLVTASLLTRQSTMEFVWARILRIYPALLVMLFITVFGLGPFFTTHHWNAYFTSPTLYKYLLKCSTLIMGVTYELPGVFQTNPFKNSVNSSLSTMPNELRMYAILAASWVFLKVTPKFRLKIFECLIVVSAVLAWVFVVLTQFNVFEKNVLSWLFFMFSSGSAYYILRDRIVLSRFFFAIAVGALIVSLFLSAINPHLFFLTYSLTLAYTLFYVAYIPSGFIREYNKLGDYSYGFYIYAFPVQQSTVALLPGVSVLAMVIISSLITLVLAVLSWHLLEKRALKLKEHYVYNTRKVLSSVMK